MKKRFIALACLALLAVACSSDSSSSSAGPEESAESVSSSSDATPASSSDSVEADEDSTEENADPDEADVDSDDTDEDDVDEEDADEEDADEEEKNVRVKTGETKSSSSSRVFVLRSSSSKARSKSSSSAVTAPADSSDTSAVVKPTPASSSSAKPSSSAAGESDEWRNTCLDVINEYRATENLGPLSLASEEKQSCTDEQAAADLAAGKGHANFGACGEGAQNSGPNVSMRYYPTYDDIVKKYLKMMWEDEKALVTSGQRDPNKDEDYPYIGHYLNMKGSYKTVSCGIAVSDDGTTGWLNIDFYAR
ncbi:MAG: hypothetical protein J6U20_00815 [Fibrobacter sp.]|nr:hypothetical protein [Fibrobacter sp.]